MEGWLRAKIDKIERDFREGHGFPLTFEAQYLCYLECYAKSRGLDPVDFWAKYAEDCKKDAPKGEKPLGHYSRITDRNKLADRVLKFRNQFDGPKGVSFKQLTESKLEELPKKFRAKKPKRAQKKPAAHSTSEGGFDLLALFGGDE